MSEFEDERTVRDDPDDPVVVRSRRTRIVHPYPDRSSTAVPLLALSALAIVGIILLLMFVGSNTANDRVSVAASTSSQVMGEHVTPQTVTVETHSVPVAPAPAPAPVIITPPRPAATVQVPGPTRTVTRQVPGPTQTVTQTVPGPTRTVTVPTPATSASGGSSGTSADTSTAGAGTSTQPDTVALGTQTRGDGTVTSISDDGRTITIRHRALTSPDMPEGTDTFTVRDASVLAGVTTGDTVGFTIERTEAGWSVVSLAPSGR